MGLDFIGKDIDSQFSKDLFHMWKQEQKEAIAERGANIDPKREEAYLQTIMRQNLNAFVCYKQLDDYTQCLAKYGLIDKKGEEYEVNTTNKQHEVRCGETHYGYTSCMTSQANQEMLYQQAALHQSCATRRAELLRCFTDRAEEENKQHNTNPLCQFEYRRLMRCGLNHMWNEYWRSLTNFGEAEEYHLYQTSHSEQKKQEYVRFVTDREVVQKTAAGMEAVEREERDNLGITRREEKKKAGGMFSSWR